MYLSVSDSKHSCVHFQVLTLVPGIVSARAVPKPLESRVVSLIYVFPSGLDVINKRSGINVTP